MKTSSAQSARQTTDDVGALVQRYGMSRFAYHTWQFQTQGQAGPTAQSATAQSATAQSATAQSATAQSVTAQSVTAQSATAQSASISVPSAQASAVGKEPVTKGAPASPIKTVSANGAQTARAEASALLPLSAQASPVFPEQQALVRSYNKNPAQLPSPIPVPAERVPQRAASNAAPLLNAPQPLPQGSALRQGGAIPPSVGGNHVPPATTPTPASQAGKRVASAPSVPAPLPSPTPQRGAPMLALSVPWEAPEDLVGRELPLLRGMRDVSPWVQALRQRSTQRFDAAVASLTHFQEVALLPPLEMLEESELAAEAAVSAISVPPSPEPVAPGPRPPLSREAVARLEPQLKPPSSPVKANQLAMVQPGGSTPLPAKLPTLPPLPPPPQTLRGPAVVADPDQARNGAPSWGGAHAPGFPVAPTTIRVATGQGPVMNGAHPQTPPAPTPAREEQNPPMEGGSGKRLQGPGKAVMPPPPSPAGNARDALRLLALKG